MEGYNEEEKELIMKLVKEIRYDPERIPPNLRYIDRKKARAATVKIKKIVSLTRTETITVAKIVGYKNEEMTRNRQPN